MMLPGMRQTNTTPSSEFERASGADIVRDPYPVYREMREESPVLIGKQWHRFGMEEMEALLVGDSTPYTVLPYDAVQKVLRDDDSFSNSVYAKTAGLVMGRTLTEMDEPEHHLHRALGPTSLYDGGDATLGR